MQLRRESAQTYALLGSALAHGAVALWLTTRPAPTQPEPAALPIEFELFEAAALEASLEPAEAPRSPAFAATSATTRDPRTRERPAPRAHAPDVTHEREAEVAEGVVAKEEQPSQIALETAAPTAPERKKAIDLSPLAAALTMRDELATRSRCGVAVAGSAADCGGGSDSAEAGRGQDALGSEPLSLIALRKELKLTPQADGSYGFDAPSFRATVAPDGRVTFADKIHDLNAFVEHNIVGMQINTAEKRRFMANTAALRDKLADAAEAQNQRHAKVTLQNTLRSVLTNAQLSPQQKRAAIFNLWDDCANDTSGSEAQAAIERFVRDYLPEGGPLAYSAADLSQLNRRRVSRRTFAPYAAEDAGVLPG